MATKYNFSDVFISYARESTPFVKKIAEEFTTRNYEIWVDWEDIPETAQWWEEICAGIDAATTFLFVVSPASALSEVCFKEVDHAHNNHKRIIPLLAEAITDDTIIEKLHPIIRSHNWLNFAADDNSFEDKLNNLLNILELDLDNLRLQTRYLVRAREWDERGRDKSFLLRGMDAYEAKLWLDAKTDKTGLELHLAYIDASLRQKEQDEALQSQQQTIRYIDIRTIPAFFITVLTVSFYAWISLPYTQLDFRSRLEFAFGISVTSGFIIAALVLYADELLRLRYPEHHTLRFLASLVYSFAFGSSLSGFLQSMFFGPPLNWLPIFTSGMAIGLGVILSSTFKLRGWQAFLCAAFCIYIGVQLTFATPERTWSPQWIPIFYFNNSAESQWLSIFLAIGLALAMFTAPLVRDILSLRKYFPKTA